MKLLGFKFSFRVGIDITSKVFLKDYYKQTVVFPIYLNSSSSLLYAII